MTPQRSQLANGRQRFYWGPIDVMIYAEAEKETNTHLLYEAHESAWKRFQEILPELVKELSILKLPIDDQDNTYLTSPIAKKMWQACRTHYPTFMTPMAAVAGAVADDLLTHYEIQGIHKAWVNNGGDIALHLTGNQQIPIGICVDSYRANETIQKLGSFTLDGQLTLNAQDPVRGIATSGWQGRSFSMGIADSVTVLAHNAASADAAATIIANAVNVDDERIQRRPACDMKDDSDLGDHLVTVHVPKLEHQIIEQALENGFAKAQTLKNQGIIWGAILNCQDQVRSVFSAQPIEANQWMDQRFIMSAGARTHYQGGGLAADKISALDGYR
jgi:ApbE superfamily uncharacterized protein (UPF0280 family)